MDGTIIATALGEFTVVVDDGIVVASGWAQTPQQIRARGVDLRDVTMYRDLGAVSASVTAYFNGDLHAVDAVPVRQRHGAFMDRALEILRTVGPGQTVSYSDLAVLAGNPGAARAAGTACARNNVPLFVPCHRVVRQDRSLGGFGFGLPMKRWLLDHETAVMGIVVPA